MQLKKQQLIQLQREINALQGKSVGSMTTKLLLIPDVDWNSYGKVYSKLKEDRLKSSEAYTKIVKTSLEIFRWRFDVKNERILQKNMTNEQKATAAKFCDEVIEIFNKYVVEEYKELLIQDKTKGGD